MTTAILQFLAAVLAVVFAISAWRVARQLDDDSLGHAAWVIVAVAVLWRAIPEAMQASVAIWALSAGEGSRVYELFIRYTPAVNHGRTLISVGLGWGLAALPLMRGQPVRRVWVGVSIIVPVLALMGGYTGWREGMTSAAHLTSLSVLGAVELVGLLVALQLALFVDTLDRYLWAFLCAYAVNVAVKVLWYSGAVGFFLGQDWYPPARVLPLIAMPAYAAGTLLARRRLARAVSGAQVTGVFEQNTATVDPARKVRS